MLTCAHSRCLPHPLRLHAQERGKAPSSSDHGESTCQGCTGSRSSAARNASTMQC
ncbi:hypothetical protein BD414DRAFT_479533 [Trametes punicea]|nr:hypothetical protein BD414DRAFT_479533 [Trametes punicea]